MPSAAALIAAGLEDQGADLHCPSGFRLGGVAGVGLGDLGVGLAQPVAQHRVQLPHLVGHRIRQVVSLAEVVLEVEQLEGLALVAFDQLPAAGSDDAVRYAAAAVVREVPKDGFALRRAAAGQVL